MRVGQPALLMRGQRGICISLGVLGVLEGPVEVRFSRIEAREPGPRASSRFVYTISPYAFGTTYKRRSGETAMPCAGRAPDAARSVT